MDRVEGVLSMSTNLGRGGKSMEVTDVWKPIANGSNRIAASNTMNKLCPIGVLPR